MTTIPLPDTASLTDSQILEALDFHAPLRCESTIQHQCSETARWHTSARCGDASPVAPKLWCDGRYALHQREMLERFSCPGCITLIADCWTVRPL